MNLTILILVLTIFPQIKLVKHQTIQVSTDNIRCNIIENTKSCTEYHNFGHIISDLVQLKKNHYAQVTTVKLQQIS